MTTWGWDSSNSLGGGGFGKVYAAYGPGTDHLAAKVVAKVEGAFSSQRRNTRSNVDYFLEPIEVRPGWFPTA